MGFVVFFFFFKILNALSIYFQLKPVILKDAIVKTERRRK